MFRMPSFGSYLSRIVSLRLKGSGKGRNIAYRIRLKTILSTSEFTPITTDRFVTVALMVQPSHCFERMVSSTANPFNFLGDSTSISYCINSPSGKSNMPSSSA